MSANVADASSPAVDLLTRDQAAAALQVHPVTISRMVRDGRLRAVHLGRSLRIPRAALDALVAGVEQPALAADHWPSTTPLW